MTTRFAQGRSITRGPSIALAAALVLLGAGCAAPTAPSGDAPPPAETVETSAPASEQAGAPVAVALPPTYPLAEVPLIDGVVVKAADAALLWNVVLVPNSPMDQVADEAEALLTARGMKLVGQKDDNRAYQSEAYDVNVNLHEEGTVSYTVRPR